MDNNLYVVYAADNAFAEILGVSLISLYENNKNFEQIHVYILENGMAEENKKNIDSICLKYGRDDICWINSKNINEVFEVEATVDRGSTSQYDRLFISSYLPDDIERILYLDSDLIVKKSLDGLWSLDLHNKTIAALKDAFSKFYRFNINLKPSDIMFNSGVMLVDLVRWREKNIEGKLVEFIKRKKGKIQQGDQGALNAVLSRDTFCFDPKFNAVSIFFDFSYKEMLEYRKPTEYYSEDMINSAVEDPVIVHYTTSFLSRRPWIIGCKHKYVGDWLKYKAMSPWKDVPLHHYSAPKGLRGIYLKIMKKFPRSVLIRVSGFLQAYGRPFVYKIFQ